MKQDKPENNDVEKSVEYSTINFPYGQRFGNFDFTECVGYDPSFSGTVGDALTRAGFTPAPNKSIRDTQDYEQTIIYM
ncbi:MAG: hypothetical protein KAU41_12705 [Deltaproteobacteria bacterium]|nr:hypothetical protein [Deltaproteobacteria bacterium]